MAQPLFTAKPAIAVSRPRDALRLAIVWGGTGLAALLLLAAVVLWLHNGTAVFFETIAAGIASCF